MVWYGLVWYFKVWYGIVWYCMTVIRYIAFCLLDHAVVKIVFLLTSSLCSERIASEHRLREKSSHSNKKQGRRSSDND